MSTLSASYALIEEPRRSVETGAATDDTLGTPTGLESNRDAWQAVIDQKLVEWWRDPAQLAEAELIPPSRAAIDGAVRIAICFRDGNVSAPMRVVPDGDGGVVFERWDGPSAESIEIASDGKAEIVLCRDGRVTKRRGL